MATISARGSVAGTDTAIYTATTNTTEIARITLHNTSASNVTVTVKIATLDMYVLTLAGSQTYEIAPKYPHVLANTETISASGTTATVVKFDLAGRDLA